MRAGVHLVEAPVFFGKRFFIEKVVLSIHQSSIMKYLPLGAVKKENPDIEFPLREDQKVIFMETCNQLFPAATENERRHFLAICSDPKGLVFASWTEENKALSNTLKNGSFSEVFHDSSKLKEHAFFEAYQSFLEPFLYPIFTHSFPALSMKNIHFFASFSELLPAYQQNLVQDSLSEWIFRQKEELSLAIGKAKKDTDLQRLVDSFLNPNLLAALDLLNVNHYRVKTQLLEFFMGLTYHPKSSTRFLMYLTNKLQQIRFTPEHKKQLTEFGSDLKKGKIVVESTRIPWLRLSLMILLIAICIAGIRMIFMVEADPENDTVQEQTAYMKLTEKRRRELDSLFKDSKSEKRMVTDTQLDSDLPFVGTDLVKKRHWNNALFRKLYGHWGNNDSVSYTKFFTQAKPYKKPYIQTKDLAKKDGEIRVKLQNETDRMLLIVVFQDNPKEPVYTKYLGAKSLAEWKINAGEYLFVLPGNKVSADQQFGNLPFKELDQHFFENLGIAYRVGEFNGKRINLNWESMSANEAYLVDFSGALVKE